jgi:aspartate aminotransferase
MGNRKLSHLAETLIPSEIVKLGGIIKEKIGEGHKIYNYTIGDFNSSLFPIPEKLEEEIIKAYEEGYTTYPIAEGELDLRKSVCSFLKKYQGLDYNPQEILIANGGRPLIYALYRTIIDKDDKVVYPVPSWNNNHYVHFTGGTHVAIEALPENNFMPTAAQLRPVIKGASLLSLCSPLNPTGTVFRKNELEEICRLVIEENESRKPGEKKLYLMYDQIYWMLTFGKTHHYDPVSLDPRMKEYTIFIDGISKSLAATGVRVGWAAGPAEIIAKMRGINSHIGSWAPMAEQKAVARFLEMHEELEAFMSHFRKEVEVRLNDIYEGFMKLKSEGFAVDALRPEAAIYLTIRIDLVGKKTRKGELLSDQSQVTSHILSEAGLAIVPFYAFGAGDNSSWYRLSVGCCKKEEIPSMLDDLKKALADLS